MHIAWRLPTRWTVVDTLKVEDVPFLNTQQQPLVDFINNHPLQLDQHFNNTLDGSQHSFCSLILSTKDNVSDHDPYAISIDIFWVFAQSQTNSS